MQPHLPPRRSPIEQQPLTVVLPRVVVRLIELDWRRNPHLYDYPPRAIHQLATWLRANGFAGLFFTLIDAAKAVEGGHKLTVWRDVLSRRPGYRATHKIRIPFSRR